MFRGVIYVACLALARQDALREQLSRLGKAPLRCKRKNNNPRFGYIRPVVVVFAFVLLARNVSGVIYVACLALARQDALREQLSRLGKAPLRCKRKNNNPRSGCIRPAVVVFAFMPSAFALPSPCRYFLTLGASIMFIFLPSSFGIISTLANSSRSVAKRSSRISPCSLKTIERPRKKT